MRQCVKVCFQEKGGTEWAEKNTASEFRVGLKNASDISR